jgi:hypothetical protein
MAAECYEFHSKASELRMIGFAIVEHGFYSTTIAGESETLGATCIVHILQGEVPEKKLEGELKNLIITHYRKRHLFVSFFIFVGADVDISNYVRRFLN